MVEGGLGGGEAVGKLGPALNSAASLACGTLLAWGKDFQVVDEEEWEVAQGGTVDRHCFKCLELKTLVSLKHSREIWEKLLESSRQD